MTTLNKYLFQDDFKIAFAFSVSSVENKMFFVMICTKGYKLL